MTRSISALVALMLFGGAIARAQEPRLVVPQPGGVNLEEAVRPEGARDAAKLYASPREAALAAFQAAYKAATEKRTERAMGLFLLSLRRDPTFAKAYYNLGVLCAQSSRWNDAINFQSEFQMQPDLDPAWRKASTSEVERLKTIARLEGSPEGQLRRRFDMTLGPALEIRDRVKGLNEAARLVRLDKSRWEGPALAGIFHAEAKAYSESAKALDEAGRLAPPNRRANIELAAAAARNEAAFGDQVRTAGLSWEKQEYEVAAKAYEAAWKTIPTRIDTGMQAATGYLMADQVAPAVEMLTRVRDFAPAAVAGRMSGMLRELGAISEAAKAAAVRSPASESAVAVAEPAAEIRALVGALSSPEVELVVRAAAPLLRDTTFVTGIPDEEISGGGSDVTPLPTDSIFAMYQRDRARTAAAAMVPVADLATQPAAVGNTYDVMVQSKTRGLPIFVNGQPSGKATPALLTLDDGDTVGVELSGEMHRGKFEAKEGLFLRFPW